MSKESIPQNNINSEERINKTYLEILNNLKILYEYELTPAEAVFLRQLTLECLNETETTLRNYDKNKKITNDALITYQEIIDRFFFYYHGINVDDILGTLEGEERMKRKKELLKYIQEKLRKDRELI